MNRVETSGSLTVLEPADGAVIPPDAASPIVRWMDTSAKLWLITLSVDGRPVCRVVWDKKFWVPKRDVWQRVQNQAGVAPVRVEVSGIGGWTQRDLVSSGVASISISSDPLGARLAFLRKRLPFRTAKDNPRDSQMVVGDMGAWGRPRVVMQDEPICFNCHVYSQDGSTYGMDFDYKGDKGGFLVADVSRNLLIKDEDIISWNDLPVPPPAKYSMGLFSVLSPDGRYAASTIGETSAFVMMEDVYFSQMFYPATGCIAIYDNESGRLAPLPGANSDRFSQTCPAFSADGSRVAFARTPVNAKLVRDILDGKLRKEDPRQTIHEANAKYPVRFDLWSVPFNSGKGGEPSPVAGASDNGMSNFFPRYSPDGKWLVFTQCRSGLVLQPDSRLVIVPADGGEPRILKANTGLMNSWHSWSPNSRWLAFASKENSPFTEVYLTHIDEDGNSSPGLRLFRFSEPEMAAMVPEFVPDNSVVQKNMELADPEGALGDSMATDGR